MASDSALRRFAAIIGLSASAIYAFAAYSGHLWANLVLAALLVLACAAYLLHADSAPPVTIAEPAPPVRPAADPMSALLDQVPIALLRYSAGGGLQTLNRAARALFHADDLVASPPPVLLDAVVNAQPGVRAALRLFDRSFAIGLSEVATPRETIWLVSLTDIQSEVRVAEATALRDLLRVLSHEIMNSLTPVSSLADTARAYLTEDGPEARSAAMEALDVLSQRAAGLARFVEAYRSLARLPDPVMRPTDLRALLQDITRVFQQGIPAHNLGLQLDLPAGDLVLDMDETLFSQALLNVLTNAAEATADNGAPRRVKVSASLAGEEIRVLVADNGGGVPATLREQIFHAFVTTKAKGTGTGLNLARQIALAHGGDLRLLDGDETWSTQFCFVFRRPGADSAERR